MNRRQKKKWNKNHITLIDIRTDQKSTIKLKDFIRLVKIAGLSKEEFEDWIKRSEEYEASGN